MYPAVHSSTTRGKCWLCIVTETLHKERMGSTAQMNGRFPLKQSSVEPSADGTSKQNRGESMWALHSHGAPAQWIRLMLAREGGVAVRPSLTGGDGLGLCQGPHRPEGPSDEGRRKEGGRGEIRAQGQPNPRISNMLTRDYPTASEMDGKCTSTGQRCEVCRVLPLMASMELDLGLSVEESQEKRSARERPTAAASRSWFVYLGKPNQNKLQPGIAPENWGQTAAALFILTMGKVL
ncbi:hypothetical protein NQZ68_004535 [Dissostichus eleginoides]|nr:hypothetical protein NQZ68_004535 [Dissostichus eleginoides]